MRCRHESKVVIIMNLDWRGNEGENEGDNEMKCESILGNETGHERNDVKMERRRSDERNEEGNDSDYMEMERRRRKGGGGGGREGRISLSYFSRRQREEDLKGREQAERT